MFTPDSGGGTILDEPGVPGRIVEAVEATTSQGELEHHSGSMVFQDSSALDVNREVQADDGGPRGTPEFGRLA